MFRLRRLVLGKEKCDWSNSWIKPRSGCAMVIETWEAEQVREGREDDTRWDVGTYKSLFQFRNERRIRFINLYCYLPDSTARNLHGETRMGIILSRLRLVVVCSTARQGRPRIRLRAGIDARLVSPLRRAGSPAA